MTGNSGKTHIHIYTEAYSYASGEPVWAISSLYATDWAFAFACAFVYVYALASVSTCHLLAYKYAIYAYKYYLSNLQ